MIHLPKLRLEDLDHSRIVSGMEGEPRKAETVGSYYHGGYLLEIGF